MDDTYIEELVKSLATDRELRNCDGCGRDTYAVFCNRCRSSYDTPNMDTLEQIAGHWDFDLSHLDDNSIEDLRDVIELAAKESCERYRVEKVYEAFEDFLD